MRKYNPYKNIFYYYRGPSSFTNHGFGDPQIEDNTTKALVNILDKSEKSLLHDFLNSVDIQVNKCDNVSYGLQIGKEKSRPDALIKVGLIEIYLESKIECPLEKEQVFNHLKGITNGYLLCITPRERDGKIVKNLNDKKIKFITWKNIYLFLKRSIDGKRSEKTLFLINEFIHYLEAINMAPFYGWKRSHFEAFLNIEEDPNKVLMYQSKDNLKKYLEDLQKDIVKIPSFKNLNMKVGSLDSDDSRHCWGVLALPPLNKIVHIPHFNFIINADEFALGVQIEGKNPTTAFQKKVIGNPKEFKNILKKLTGFNLIIRKRINIKPRKFIGIPVTNIALGDNISESDIIYLIEKMKQYHLFEVNCTKSFKRDDLILASPSFLSKSFELMKRLESYYKFSINNNLV